MLSIADKSIIRLKLFRLVDQNNVLTGGEFISHYRIVSSIGAGGMGEVYLAEDTKLDRKVALKVLLNDFSEDKERINRFIREAKAASALNHPNILTVYEIGNSDGSQYISTELIKGETLRERTKREPIELRDALKIVMQITAALGAAHEAGIIHRDIKPENIMIRSDGVVKVLDFGLAKLSPLSTASVETTLPQINTKPGMIVGTIAYMSPEQARGRTIDPRSDIFSLGIVMFELFTGQRPFDGESQLELVSSILKDDPPTLRQIAPKMPRELERIVDKALRKDREHRYQHIKDLLIDIEDLDEELKFESKLNRSTQPTTAGDIQVTNRSNLRSAFTTGISKTRRFTLLHALLFIAIAGAIGVGVWYLRPTTTPVVANYKTREVATWLAAPGELGATASFSPDGNLIAFSSTKSGTTGIWIAQSNSTESRPVTSDSFANTQPIFSPNGDEIAYSSLRPNSNGGNSVEIWRIAALGGTGKLIGTLPGNLPVGSATLLRWGDSGHLYYSLSGDVYSIDLVRGASQKVTSLGMPQIAAIEVSSDEKTIYFSAKAGDRWQVFRTTTDGTKPIEIATEEGSIGRRLLLSEDTRRLFYSVRQNDITNVCLLDIATGGRKVLAEFEDAASVESADPKGRSLLISSSKDESHIWRVGIANQDESLVARDVNVKLWPTVSADNSKIAFQSVKNLSSGNNLYKGRVVAKSITQAENEAPFPLSSEGFFPQWSPDGSHVAFLKKKDSSVNLHVVNSAGGGERTLVEGNLSWANYTPTPYNVVQTSVFAWSPDGSKIAYIAENGKAQSVALVNINDGSTSPLTPEIADMALFCPMFDADGGKLAFSYKAKQKDQNGQLTGGLRSVDLATNSVATVFETTRPIRLLDWTPDGNSLVIAEPSQTLVGLPGETKLSKISINGATETRIANLKNTYYYNIFLEANRKQIAYVARNQNLDDVWVMPVLGGPARKVSNNRDSGQYFSRLAWLRDGSSIVFGKQTRYSSLIKMTDIE